MDIDALAKRLGRTTIATEDDTGTAAPAPTPAAGGDRSYWDVYYSQYGPVSEEPMSRFAQVASGAVEKGAIC